MLAFLRHQARKKAARFSCLILRIDPKPTRGPPSLLSIVVKPFPSLNAQLLLLDQPPQVLARPTRYSVPALGVVLLDVVNDVKAHDVHLLERAGLGRQHRLKNSIDLRGGSDAFGGRKERFALDDGPDPVADGEC